MIIAELVQCNVLLCARRQYIADRSSVSTNNIHAPVVTEACRMLACRVSDAAHCLQQLELTAQIHARLDLTFSSD